MTRFFTLFLLLLSIPYGLQAEAVTVRSGEHAGFSRLVMQFPTQIEWDFGRSGGTYEFRVDQKNIVFETGDVFDKIPRTRIMDLEVGAGFFKLLTPRNVHADVFELRAGRIVIDIKDGLPQSQSDFETDIDAAPEQSTESISEESLNAGRKPSVHINFEGLSDQTTEEDYLESGGGNDFSSTALGERIAPQLRSEFPIILSGDQHDSTIDMPIQPLGAEVFEAQLVEQTDRVDELQQQLLGQIGRAISQGLLEADISSTDKVVRQSDFHEGRGGDRPQVDEEVHDFVDAQPQKDRSHIRIQSSIDREQNPLAESQISDGRGTLCLDDQLVDISNWGNELEKGLDLPALRIATIGEFDTPDPVGVKRLAQYYIFLTFGAEAKSVLKNFGVMVENRDLLWAMADIMEQGYTNNPGRLAEQFSCSGAVSFWSVMAKQKLNSWEDYNLESVLATFSAFPIHLRRHLGPTLSERFLAAGDQKSAEYIQNAIARASGDHGDAFALLNAELTLADGNFYDGVGMLETIVEEDVGSTPEALVKLISTQAAADATIDRSIAETVEAMAVEFRGSPYESTLRNAAILARIYSGDAAMAVREIVSLPSKEIPVGVENPLLSRALDKLAENSSDLEFSKIMFAHSEMISKAQISDSVRLKVAERLLKLGFFGVVLDIMAGFSDQDNDEAKFVLAKAFWGEGEFEAALRYATQVNGDEARRIEAKAYFQLNQPEDAIRVLDGTLRNSASDVFAVVAEDWPSLGKSNEPELSQFAKVMQKDAEISDLRQDAIPTLSTLDDLLTSSRETRDALVSILD